MGRTSISVAGRQTVASAPAGKCLARRHQTPGDRRASARTSLGCLQLRPFEFYLSIFYPWPIGAGFC